MNTFWYWTYHKNAHVMQRKLQELDYQNTIKILYLNGILNEYWYGILKVCNERKIAINKNIRVYNIKMYCRNIRNSQSIAEDNRERERCLRLFHSCYARKLLSARKQIGIAPDGTKKETVERRNRPGEGRVLPTMLVTLKNSRGQHNAISRSCWEMCQG